MKVVFDFNFADVGTSEARARSAASMAPSANIPDEDHAICGSVQRGLASHAHDAGRLSARREAAESLFHRSLAGDLRAELARAG